MDARNSRLTLEGFSPRTFWRTVRFAQMTGRILPANVQEYATVIEWEGYATVQEQSIKIWGYNFSREKPPLYWTNRRRE